MDKRYEIKVERDDPRWQMDFDLKERVLHVYMENIVPDGRVESADKLNVVDFCLSRDNLPYVVGVTIRDPNKFSIIEDWIYEATENGMDAFNVERQDTFADNHWKGVEFSEFYR